MPPLSRWSCTVDNSRNTRCRPGSPRCAHTAGRSTPYRRRYRAAPHNTTEYGGFITLAPIHTLAVARRRTTRSSIARSNTAPPPLQSVVDEHGSATHRPGFFLPLPSWTERPGVFGIFLRPVAPGRFDSGPVPWFYHATAPALDRGRGTWWIGPASHCPPARRAFLPACLKPTHLSAFEPRPSRFHIAIFGLPYYRPQQFGLSSPAQCWVRRTLPR